MIRRDRPVSFETAEFLGLLRMTGVGGLQNMRQAEERDAIARLEARTGVRP